MKRKDITNTLPLWIITSIYIFYAYNEIGRSLAIFGFSFVWAIWISLMIVSSWETKGKQHVDTSGDNNAYEQHFE